MRGFQTGHKLAKGRPPGSKNIRTRPVMEILAKLKGGDGKLGFDPLKELIECYHRCANTDGVMHVAVKCLDILMPYVHAKVTPTEGFSAADVALIEQIKELSSRPKQEIIDITKAELKKVE